MAPMKLKKNSVELSPFQQYNEPIFVDEKAESFIYRISDNCVGKVAKSTLEIGREMKLARLLYEAGISVPRPLAWGQISVPQEYGQLKPAFIMEYIPGLTLERMLNNEFSTSEYKYALDLQQRELEKAQQEGFDVGYDGQNRGNAIYSTDAEITLIDFSSWSHKDVPHIKRKFVDDKLRLMNYVSPESVVFD